MSECDPDTMCCDGLDIDVCDISDDPACADAAFDSDDVWDGLDDPQPMKFARHASLDQQIAVLEPRLWKAQQTFSRLRTRNEATHRLLCLTKDHCTNQAARDALATVMTAYSDDVNAEEKLECRIEVLTAQLADLKKKNDTAHAAGICFMIFFLVAGCVIQRYFPSACLNLQNAILRLKG
jgi:hypothetical protein